jgi:hypothetical protein
MQQCPRWSPYGSPLPSRRPGRSAGPRPADERRPAGVGDERGEAFDLPLNGVRLGVGAVAAAPAVVDVHGEVLHQQLDRWPLGEVAAVQDPDPA